MTKEETKRILRAKIGLKAVCVLESDEERQLVCELIEKDKKYRRHDLRKNPDDLPLDYKRVLICLKGFESNLAGVLIAIHSRLSKKWETETFTYDDDDIVEWREIEPFEEE